MILSHAVHNEFATVSNVDKRILIETIVGVSDKVEKLVTGRWE